MFAARMQRASAVASALALAAALACSGPASRPAATPASGARRPSNVVRADYASSKACAGCHAEIARAFDASAMHNMTRDVAGARIVAPFAGETLKLKSDQATLTTENGARLVRVRSSRFGDHTYRVTRVIGGHHREDFVGVDVDLASRRGAIADEEILPVSFLIERRALRYKGYSVMTEDRPAMRAGPVWRETCVFCHNTVPFLSTVLGTLVGPGAPGYQGATVDRFLPTESRLRYTPGPGLDDALRAEISLLRGPGRDASDVAGGQAGLLATALGETRARMDAAHFVELGIGCESCHGGARDHVADPTQHPSYAPSGEALTVSLPRPPENPEAARAQWITRTCARCHQVLFSGYRHTWEGGLRDRAPGGSHINSGEARDFLLGACATRMTCTTCHDPHGRAKNAEAFAGGFANEAGDAVCTQCHGAYAAPSARAAHSRHRADGEGSHCVSCHMPKKNMGLDGRLTRYHRISSPTERVKVEEDRPLECALCHGDKTVGAVLDDMDRLFGKRYDRARVAALYGGLDVNVIAGTLARGHAHEQATACAVAGARRDAATAPLLVEVLGSKYPVVRDYAKDALEALAGAPLPVDLTTDKERILEEARAWQRRVLPARR